MNTKFTPDLLPCPFCGGKAERVDIEDGNNAGGSFIHCTVCDASGNVEFEFKENFVSNWNRRALSADPDMLAALWRAEDAVEQLCIGQDPANECWNVLMQIRSALSKAQVQS